MYLEDAQKERKTVKKRKTTGYFEREQKKDKEFMNSILKRIRKKITLLNAKSIQS